MTSSPPAAARSPTLAPAVLPQPSEEIDAEMASVMRSTSQRTTKHTQLQTITSRSGAPSPHPLPATGDGTQKSQIPNTASEMSGSTVGDGDGEKGMDVEAQSVREPDIYDRFPPKKKHAIVAIVSFAAFIGRESKCRSGLMV